MHEPVDGGQRQGRLDEHLTPLRERRIGRDGQALVFVAVSYTHLTLPTKRIV